MEDLTETASGRMPLARVGEPTRLRMQWLSLAYEKLCPMGRDRRRVPPQAACDALAMDWEPQALRQPALAAIGAFHD